MTATPSAIQSPITFEDLIFRKQDISPITRQTIIGQMQTYLVQYSHKTHTPIPNNNFLNTILKSLVYTLQVNQIHNQLHVGEQRIYVIWDKSVLFLSSLYEHLAALFKIHLAVGPHNIFKTIESSIVPYQIINIEKVNGDFMQNFEDLFTEHAINVYCKIFTHEIKQQCSHIVSPRYSNKFASPKTNYDKFINTVNVSNRIKYLYIKNQQSSNHSHQGFFNTPTIDTENKKPQSETNISNVTFLTPCKTQPKCLKLAESLNSSPIKTDVKKLAPLSFNDFHANGTVSYVNLGLVPRSIKSSEPNFLKRRTSIRIKRVLKIY